jgi:pantothenate kinase
VTGTVAVGFADLVTAARALGGGGRRAVVGITGSPGSGKSTLTENLLSALRDDPPGGFSSEWVAHVPMDGFHLADVELDRLGLRDRKGAPETFDAHGYVDLLTRLRADRTDEVIYAPQFERDLEQPIAAAIPVRPPARLVLTEGNYLLLDDPPWGRLRTLLDAVWFCAPDDDLRLDRLVRRHVRFGKSPQAAQAWAHGTDERNARRVAATRSRADLVVGPGVLDRLAPA